MALETSIPRSRRALLAAAVGGFGALVAAALGRPPAAKAAAGDTLILGQANSAGTKQTTLTADVAGAAFTLKDPNTFGTGIFGWSSATTGPGRGVYGRADAPNSFGVYAVQNSGSVGNGAAIRAVGNQNNGLYATTSTDGRSAVRAIHDGFTEVGGYAVFGEGSMNATGVYAKSNEGLGVRAISNSGTAVYGQSSSGLGVVGASSGNTALLGLGNGAVTGSFSKAGGSFKIDHPLAPASKYLQHSFVESPDMKNVYDGVVTLDAQGEATVELPGYFEVLNRDLRYQLTPLGAPAPELHVKATVARGRFTIAGGERGQEVCWQLTGIRRDPWAEAHRIVVEEPKTGKERETYLHPELYGQPESKGLDYEMRQKAGIGR